MRRALRRAARLLAAGALGLAGPAALAASEPGPLALTGAVPPTPSQARLEVMKVELAWLADPLTFQAGLQAAVSGRTLEVRGAVPNLAVKERALEVARRHSYLPVADAVTVAGPAARVQEGRSADELRRSASNVLVRAFGTRAMGLEVSAKPGGEVTVRGSVPSLEDKLAVSRELRRLPGCVCVVNLVRTPGSAEESGAVTPASSPAAEPVPPRVTRTSASAPAPEAPAAPVVTATIPSGLPPVPPAAERRRLLASRRTVTGPAYDWRMSYLAYSAPLPAGAAEPAPASPTSGVVVVSGPAEKVHEPAADKAVTPALREESWPPAHAIRPAAGYAESPDPLPAPAAGPTDVRPAPAAGAASPAPRSDRFLRRLFNRFSSSGSRPATQQPPAPAPGTDTTSGKEPALAPRLAPIPSATPPGRLTPVPAAPTPGKSTPATAGTPAVPAAPAAPPSPEQLRKLVERAAGHLAKEVVVTAGPDRALTVKVTASSADAEKQLIDKVLTVPEMAGPQVKLEVVVPEVGAAKGAAPKPE